MPFFHLNIQQHARIATLGDAADVEQIWLVLHGYGQLAHYFIRKFNAHQSPHCLFVAPEGLHRFYLSGHSGRVGASWMTKEDRLTDIANNNTYLNTVWQHYRHLFPKANINVLGFSQGAATTVRWFCQSNETPQHLIIWAGSFPEDLNWFEDIPKLNRSKLTFAFGNDDPFFTEETLKQRLDTLHDKGLQFTVVRFEGKHDIDSETLASLL